MSSTNTQDTHRRSTRAKTRTTRAEYALKLNKTNETLMNAEDEQENMEITLKIKKTSK
jgi:hypothetical protein